MDIFMVVTLLLPMCIGVSIWQAVKGEHRRHILIQKLLFFIALLVFPYTMYQLHYQGIADSEKIFYFFLSYVLISLITLLLWLSTLSYAKADRRRRALPGLYSKGHKRLGRIVSFLILLSSLAGVILYGVLFVS